MFGVHAWFCPEIIDSFMEKVLAINVYFLRKECVQYWIDRPRSLRDTDLFTGDFIGVNRDIEVLQASIEIK